MVTPRAGEAVDPAVAKLCAQEGALTGVEDAQMSSRYRWLVTQPASHALLSAAEAPVCLQKRLANTCLTSGAMRGLAAHKHRRLFLQKLPHCVAIHCDRLLHIRLWLARLAGEGAHELRYAPRLEGAHLVLIEKVLHGIAAAEEEEGRADRRGLFLQLRALEQEAPEWRDARARPDHDHWQVRVLGGAQRDRQLKDEGVHRGVGRLRGEIVRADPAKLAAPAERPAL